MIADVSVTEKSFGAKTLLTQVRFSIDSGEKLGIVGRNGVGKTSLVRRFVEASNIGYYNSLYGDRKAADALIKKINPVIVVDYIEKYLPILRALIDVGDASGIGFCVLF